MHYLLVSLVCLSLLSCALVCSSSARPAFANALVEKHNRAGTEAFEQARYAEAEKSFLSAIRAAEASGANSPDVAKSLCNLAELYLDQGKYAKAESLYKHALAIYEKAFGSNHCYSARALDNLAVLYKEQGKYAAGRADAQARFVDIRKDARTK
jgi:tetratricopeptide (TPR) repeat protein